MRYAIKNRWTGEEIFIAEINADESAPDATRLGLAVKAALADGMSLTDSDLHGADLNSADLHYANLTNANLYGTNLQGADLADAELHRANLRAANLDDANLSGANLRCADLNGANLTGANLFDAVGNARQIKSLFFDRYVVVYTADRLQIGCENHAIDAWRTFDDARIRQMDGRAAVQWWHEWKMEIFRTIETSPAEPTGSACR